MQYRGSLLWFAPRDKFTLGQDPKSNKMAAINLRCLEAFELDQVPVKHADGRSF